MPLSLGNLSILLVEDTVPMRKIMVSVLEIIGFRKIYTAGDGEEGFRVFQQSRPDIVITDWLMTPQDGLYLIEKIRTHPTSHNRTVPVILVTGYSAAPKVMSARDQGMTEFLIKPFTAKELAMRSTHVINKPRDFVEAPTFVGPDRRRRADEGYEGPVRRTAERHRKKKNKEEGS